MNDNYTLTTSTAGGAYNNIADGGSIMGLGVKYGIGDAGEDFSQQQFGVSIDSELVSNNPIGVYLFFKSRATLVYSGSGIQLIQ